ncbi:MAG: efflux RND transporter periplasmic adaptor subunit [Planctomycetota bacterium]|nr:efflux RND transporter periplasmic adaptor subunit [Planctomycetota bacterium]
MQRSGILWRVILSVVLIVGSLGLGLGAFFALWSARKPPAKRETVLPFITVRTEEVTRGPYREMLTGYGRARALRRAEVAAEVAGLVEETSLEAGALVKEGTVLVRLDDRDLKNELAMRKARLDQTRAERDRLDVERESLELQHTTANEELQAAQRELDRLVTLVETKVATQSELDSQRMLTALTRKATQELKGRVDRVEPEKRRLDAAIAAASADLDRAHHDLERAVIRSPFDGRIVERKVNQGDRVAVGTTLFSVVDLERIEIPVALPASRYGEVIPGSAAVVRLKAGAEPVWRGQVARVSPVVSDRDRTFFAYLVVEDEKTPIPPGAFVIASIGGRRYDDVIAVPRTAFVGDTVFVAVKVRKETQAQARTPEVAALLPQVALVRGGLESGDRIIVTNLEQVADQTVVVEAPSAPDSPERE